MENGRNKIDNEFWQSYRTTLYKFIRTRVNDGETAEDIVQDVLVKAYDKQDTLQNNQKVLPWLYQITRNVIVDHYRKKQTNEPLTENQMIAELELDNTFELDLARCMLPLVKKLPETQQQAIRLSEFEGLSQKEVALKLGLSLSGAKSRIQRARKLLKNMLLDCCRIELDRRGQVVEFKQRGACDGNC